MYPSSKILEILWQSPQDLFHNQPERERREALSSEVALGFQKRSILLPLLEMRNLPQDKSDFVLKALPKVVRNRHTFHEFEEVFRHNSTFAKAS